MTTYPPATCASISCSASKIAQSVTPAAVCIHKYSLLIVVLALAESQVSLPLHKMLAFDSWVLRFPVIQAMCDSHVIQHVCDGHSTISGSNAAHLIRT